MNVYWFTPLHYPCPPAGCWSPHTPNAKEPYAQFAQCPVDALWVPPAHSPTSEYLVHLVEIPEDATKSPDWISIEAYSPNKIRIEQTAPATQLLRHFARSISASMLGALPDCPGVARKYIRTGDESLRQEAYAAAEKVAASLAKNDERSAWRSARTLMWATAGDALTGAAYSTAWSEIDHETLLRLAVTTALELQGKDIHA